MGQKRKNGLRNCKRFQTVQSSRFTTCMFDFNHHRAYSAGLSCIRGEQRRFACALAMFKPFYRVSRIRLFRMRLLRFRCFHLRFFRAGLSIIRFFLLFFRLPDGLFVKVVFGIIHASVCAAHTFAHQIAALFQFFKRRPDAFHPFFTDGGQPANREIPILRQCQNHCQQALCLERQSLIPQMIIADRRVILDLLYAKYAHMKTLHSICKFKTR